MIWDCIRCYKTWGDGLDDDGFMSSGLCKDCLRECLTDLYRERQNKEPGSFPCFGTADYFCDQDCSYKKICLKDENDE